ncbi:hypothetical protein [Streptacidiphilus carbonis]|uniref:hypothetical protein n=1 Tax=Streptacidiphilus carbonis TaxID=105422 RepID=UPI0005A92D15|nr:hypothetical protein [Streptacidiphilus carbonis]
MTGPRYRVVFTDAARAQMRLLDGAERLAGIPAGVLNREALAALLAGTVLGDLLTALEELAGDPYGALSLARTGEAEDDRTALLANILAVTYMVSPATEPPVITVTTVRPPKG